LHKSGEFQQLYRKKLHEQVYDILKQDILNQHIVFGEKLTNRGLQERYNVSSTPVRDAINRLYQEGLLDEITQGGARVIPFDYKRAVDVNELMFILHKEAIALSVERAASEDVVFHLQAALEQQSENLLNELYFQYDQQFHQVFFNFCDNSQLIRIYTQQSGLWMLLLKLYHAAQDDSRIKAFSQHTQIVAAYKNGEIELIQTLVKEHFAGAVGHFKNMLHH
jgi:DNA-binding GntR family transcriptional regulator